MRFQLTDALRTGVAEIDGEHHDLIARINLIAELEQRSSGTAVVEALRQFRTDLESHFQSEEAYLRKAAYPHGDAHAAHHAETLAALDRLIDGVKDGRAPAEGVANFCYHELITTILRKDMEFANWLADHSE